MEKLHQPVLNHLAEEIHIVLNKLAPNHELTVRDIYNLITTPPNLKMGHLAFPAFPLAKLLKKAPNMIAADLSNEISSSDLIKEAKPVGPYLNFFLNLENVSKLLVPQMISGELYKQELGEKKEKIMIEYSQPNTHKILHVGHMRNLCLGNALVKLYQYIGNEVISSTYPGDVGTHIAKCLWYLKHKHEGVYPEENKGEWLGQIYVKATHELDKLKDTDEEVAVKQIFTQILSELEEGHGEFFELWKITREWSLKVFNKAYAWSDVKFDKWYFESEVDSKSLNRVKKLYEDGKLEKSEGAIGMNLEDDKLGFCILIKSDGNGLYSTKDIELAHEKFEEYKLDKSLYVVDKRQEFHFKQVFKVLEKIGFPKASGCHHLQYDFVELPSGAMSSRRGNVIPLMELVNNMEETIKTNYLNKYIDEWDEEEINLTAHIIADGAIKYGMLRMDPARKIVFVMEDWLKLDGETGPYLQYVYARINSMLNKFNFDPSTDLNFSHLKEASEEALILKLIDFNSVAYQAAVQEKPSSLCTYLYELGKLFNSFYAECPIGKADNEEVKLMRLALSKACSEVIKQGLKIIGIKTPSRM